MKRESDRDYHLRRARAELDLAFRADRGPAAAAHMRLSSFHMTALSDLPPAPGRHVRAG